MLLSDESKINNFRSDGRQTVWRKPNKELEKQKIASTVKNGAGEVIVWGCMSASGVVELVFIDEIMDKVKYTDTPQEKCRKVKFTIFFHFST